jgi:hypothetical protein
MERKKNGRRDEAGHSGERPLRGRPSGGPLPSGRTGGPCARGGRVRTEAAGGTGDGRAVRLRSPSGRAMRRARFASGPSCQDGGSAGRLGPSFNTPSRKLPCVARQLLLDQVWVTSEIVYKVARAIASIRPIALDHGLIENLVGGLILLVVVNRAIASWKHLVETGTRIH